jgi:hypothetical protein
LIEKRIEYLHYDKSKSAGFILKNGAMSTLQIHMNRVGEKISWFALAVMKIFNSFFQSNDFCTIPHIAFFRICGKVKLSYLDQ